VSETIRLGEIAVAVTRKAVKHVHLSVYPPEGRVTLVTPMDTRPEVARAYAISKLAWIRDRQAQLRRQAREPRREFVTRESHYVWGKRHLLVVAEHNSKPTVTLDHRRIRLTVRPGIDRMARAATVHEWHKSLLHREIPSLIEKWEARLKVRVAAYFLQRMKTKWGSCNVRSRNIRINTELVKKPKDLLEYVVVHEMVHLRVPTHSQRFAELMSEHYPGWREAREELNALPIADERWG